MGDRIGNEEGRADKEGRVRVLESDLVCISFFASCYLCDPGKLS